MTPQGVGGAEAERGGGAEEEEGGEADNMR